jgi:hypothetical protein
MTKSPGRSTPPDAGAECMATMRTRAGREHLFMAALPYGWTVTSWRDDGLNALPCDADGQAPEGRVRPLLRGALPDRRGVGHAGGGVVLAEGSGPWRPQSLPVGTRSRRGCAAWTCCDPPCPRRPHRRGKWPCEPLHLHPQQESNHAPMPRWEAPAARCRACEGACGRPWQDAAGAPAGARGQVPGWTPRGLRPIRTGCAPCGKRPPCGRGLGCGAHLAAPRLVGFRGPWVLPTGQLGGAGGALRVTPERPPRTGSHLKCGAQPAVS